MDQARDVKNAIKLNAQPLMSTNNQSIYLEKIIAQMINYSQLDFDETLDIIEEADVNELIPGLAVGVNILGEELRHKVKELKNLNEELGNRNVFIQSVTDAVPDIIYICNLQNNQITYLNKCTSTNSNYSCPVLVMNKSHLCHHCNIPGTIKEGKKNSVIEIINESEIKVMPANQLPKWYRSTTNEFEKDSSGKVISVIKTLSDITLLKEKEIQLIKKEEAITSSLKEKELLLQEIHHRVKNNLQIISGLLTLQINRASSGEVINHLTEIQSRILSISLIHEELYQSEAFAKIDMSKYCVKLCNQLAPLYETPGLNIEFIFNIQPQIYWSIDKATPLGLIINEIICNSYKHAFKKLKKGILSVQFFATEQNYVLEIQDNGEGFVEPDINTKKNTLGSKLIKGLIMQLEGSMEITTNNGYAITVTIPKKIIN